VDLVIFRDDPTINLCEMKFTMKPFNISAKYEENLRYKLEVLADATNHKKSIQITMVTASGLDNSSHKSIISNIVTLDDFFE